MKKIVAAVLLVLFLAGISFADDVDILIQKLVEKKVLDAGEAQQMLADTKDDTLAKTAAGSLNGVPAWVNNITWSGYTQMSYSNTPGVVDPFTIKRARIALTATPVPWMTFKIQPDFSGIQIVPAATVATTTSAVTGVATDKNKYVTGVTTTIGATMAFKEIWADLVADKDFATFRIGQYHEPFGFELPYSSSKKKLFDTPQYFKLIMQDDYDYGIQLWGNLGSMKDYLQYRIAVLNGTTTGGETNVYKDYAMRLTSLPMKELELGFSTYFRFLETSHAYNTSLDVYAKWEADSFFMLASFPTFFTFEVAGGYDVTGAKQALDTIVTLEVQPFGLLMPSLSGIAPVIRFEQWSPNQNEADAGKSTVNYQTFGVNLYLDKAVKILADYRIPAFTPDKSTFNCMLQLNY